MTHYKSNLRDLEFNLFEVFNRQEIMGSGPFEDFDEDTAEVEEQDPHRFRVDNGHREVGPKRRSMARIVVDRPAGVHRRRMTRMSPWASD